MCAGDAGSSARYGDEINTQKKTKSNLKSYTMITGAHSRQIAAQERVKPRYSGHTIQNQRRQESSERSNLKVFSSGALLFVFRWLLSANCDFCDIFNSTFNSRLLYPIEQSWIQPTPSCSRLWKTHIAS